MATANIAILPPLAGPSASSGSACNSLSRRARRQISSSVRLGSGAFGLRGLAMMGSSVGPYQPLAGAGVPDSTMFLGLKREAGGTCNGTMVLTRVGGGMRGRVRAFLLVRLEYARPEEQKIPAAHQHAVIERPAQFCLRPPVADRRKRKEVGADRQNIVADQFREIGVGECGVIARAVGPYSLTQGAVKVVVTPCAEAGIAIRRQVRGIDPAERRVDPFSAGKGLGGIGGVATGATGGVRQRLAQRDSLRRGLGQRMTNVERGAQKYDRGNRSHCAIIVLHRFASYSAKPCRRERYVVSLSRHAATQDEKSLRRFGHEIANRS